MTRKKKQMQLLSGCKELLFAKSLSCFWNLTCQHLSKIIMDLKRFFFFKLAYNWHVKLETLKRNMLGIVRLWNFNKAAFRTPQTWNRISAPEKTTSWRWERFNLSDYSLSQRNSFSFAPRKKASNIQGNIKWSKYAL